MNGERHCAQCSGPLCRNERENEGFWRRRRFCDDECRKLSARDSLPEPERAHAMTHDEIAERMSDDGDPMTRSTVQRIEARALSKLRIALGVNPVSALRGMAAH